MWRLQATINFGAQLGEPTVTWDFVTEEELDDMLNYLTDTMNPMGITWCFTRLEVADPECKYGFAGKHNQQYDDDYCVDCGAYMELVA
tara:strand:- start:241 stop:504 length:264 start_codon:yes stop_codon:yes gene_type:complete